MAPEIGRKEHLKPINGQSVCSYAKKPFGWKTMSYNGCVILAIYNAILRGGREITVEKVHALLHRPWKGRLLGVRTYEIPRCLKALNIPFRRLCSVGEMESLMEPGDIAIIMQWNGFLPYCHFTMGEEHLSVTEIPNPFEGAHAMAVERLKTGGWRVYNRYSNRGHPYDYTHLEDFMESRACFMAGFLLLL
ncbi:MAG: hypothetical protein IKT58_02935 [Oscillospiraceae bacterium]|nr:hypothetical protein [Oscillospiraceae bacterium]